MRCHLVKPTEAKCEKCSEEDIAGNLEQSINNCKQLVLAAYHGTGVSDCMRHFSSGRSKTLKQANCDLLQVKCLPLQWTSGS